MTRSQIILVVVAVVAIATIYQLPTSVVENESGITLDVHDMSVSDADASAIQSLRSKLVSDETENLSNFADSLARYYLKYGYLDSAISISRSYLVQENSSLEMLRQAGEIAYATFERSQTSIEASERLSLVEGIYQRIIAEDPNDLKARTRLAMTLVTSQNPMAGITMLREVLEIDPNYREAILNLGLLSIRSGQYDRAIERFDKLIAMDDKDYEAMLYMGIALKEKGDTVAATYFERIVETPEADPALVVTAQQYLQEN